MSTTNRRYDFFNTASRLPAHVTRGLFLAAALAGTAGTLAALAHGPAVPATQAAQSPTTTLPEIVVRPQPEIVTLATVTVRASDALPADAIDASDSTSASRRRAARQHAVASFATGGAAGTGFGMPYYSFAQPMRVSNEE